MICAVYSSIFKTHYFNCDLYLICSHVLAIQNSYSSCHFVCSFVKPHCKKSEYKISLDYDKELDLKKVFLEDLTSKNTLEINYDNFENIGSQKLPKNVKIIIKGQKTDQIFIENTKFDFLKMETPFSIPANYTKTIIK